MTAESNGLDLAAIGRVVSSAADVPGSREGTMVVSLPGLLAHAASALREMAAPLERGSELANQEMEERLGEAQPEFYAYGLDQLCEHLAQLKQAFEAGDSAKVKAFFDLYSFA